MASALTDRRRWSAIAALLLGAAFAIRAQHFGNPVIHVDESFYLLVGDRMWQGLLPYVDIWDRKPVGLFLIYAAIRGLGGDGVVQYQIVATLFAAAAGFLVARMAARFASLEAAAIAGLLSILWLETSGGEGGQAPVFYNPLMAGAALLVMRLWCEPSTPARIRRHGVAAMALVGLALQIKYSVLLEGVAFGVMLLGLAWRADPRPLPRMADAVLWIAVALLPTGLAWGWFAAIGAGPDFIYANFTSILDRAPDAGAILLKRLVKMVAILSPLLLAVLLAGWRRRSNPLPASGERALRFSGWWFAAAWASVLIFGSYFSHYALPLIPPIALAAAPAFERRGGERWPAMVAALLILFGLGASLAATSKNLTRRGDRAWIEHVAGLIRPRLANCPYIFDGEAILYKMTGACLPSRWAFPNHINLTREAGALGVDPETELRRILAGRPSVIVDTIGHRPDVNTAMQAILRAELDRNYDLVEAVPLPSRKEWRMVYQRLPGR